MTFAAKATPIKEWIMTEHTIFPMVVGVNETDQGVMTYLRNYGTRIWLPIYVFLIKGAGKNIIVDSGLEQFVIPSDFEKAYGLKVFEFEDALAQHDLRPEDIDIIIHTHLHNDHCENDYKCTNAKVYVQKAEYAFMQEPHPVDHRYYPDILDDVDVVTLEGDATIAEGIDVILTPGHSPGGQSVAVTTAKGRAVITGFCCNEKNFPQTGPAVCPGVHLNAIQAYDSVQKVKEIADIVIPLHDFNVGKQQQIP